MNSTINKPAVYIISPEYCLPYPTELTISSVKEELVVVDGNDNLRFKVTSKPKFFYDKKLIVDANNGKKVITLREKSFSAHNRWQVFKGDSSEVQDLIFTVKTSSIFQMKTKLNVYLANGNSDGDEEGVCDYMVKGSLSEKSCVIYAGNSTNKKKKKNVVAEMKKKSKFLGKEKLMVTVNANTDYAFVVALIVILDAINAQGVAAAAAAAEASAATFSVAFSA